MAVAVHTVRSRGSQAGSCCHPLPPGNRPEATSTRVPASVALCAAAKLARQTTPSGSGAT